jgi:hypothetical protein
MSPVWRGCDPDGRTTWYNGITYLGLKGARSVPVHGTLHSSLEHSLLIQTSFSFIDL